MIDMDYVQAEQFYQDGGDKIKLNWFCYEYANNLYMEIRTNAKLIRYRETHSPKQIATFCAYFAKRMRKSVYDKLTGATDSIAIADKYIYEFYPKSSRIQTHFLIDAAATAWENQISTCDGCSTRCLSEGFEISPMFDRLKKTGWPT